MEKLFVVVNTTPLNGELAYVAREEEKAQDWALDKLHDALSQANEDKFNYPDLNNLEVDEFQNLLIASAEYGSAELRIFSADLSEPEIEVFTFIDEDGDEFTFSRQKILRKLEACEEEERKKARRR